MIRSTLVSAMLASTLAFSVAEEGAAAAPAKSIVPARYAGKYKNGGSGPVPEFIKSQAYDQGAIVLESFWALCRKNELPEDKVEHYIQLVEDKAQGANGKARMTLGNMLAAKARKQGFLIDLAGNQVELDVPKPTLSGAAAKAAETKVADTEVANDEVQDDEVDGDEVTEDEDETE